MRSFVQNARKMCHAKETGQNAGVNGVTDHGIGTGGDPLVPTFEEQHPNMKVPGVMAALSARGYCTATYSSRWNSLDEEMFQEVGVQQQVYPPDSLAPPASRQDLRAEWMKNRMVRDLATLELMKRDVGECLAHGRNFASVFLPQISHLPYPDVAKSQQQDIRTHARAILEIEDGWLGELMDLLEQRHQLDDTVIVITGDHGIRTSKEDPHYCKSAPGFSGLIGCIMYIKHPWRCCWPGIRQG